MRAITLLFSILYCYSLNAQSKGKIKLELGTGLHTYSMKRINQHYLKDFAIPLGVFDNNLNVGYSYHVSVSYLFNELFSAGLYGNYQFCNTQKTESITFTDLSGNEIGTFDRTNKLQSNSQGLGITTNWYFSHLLKFHQKENKLLKRVNLSSELNFGYGVNKTNLSFIVPNKTDFSTEENFTSSGFQGQLGIKMEYNYLTHPFLGSIGIKLGYQYFKTTTLKDEKGNDWLVGTNKVPINSDFSGFFIKMYLAFKK